MLLRMWPCWLAVHHSHCFACVSQAALSHFTQVGSLHETIWKQFPEIARALGPRVIKRHLELFIDPMIRCLSSHSRLAAYAAGDCIVAMQKLVRAVLTHAARVLLKRVFLRLHADWSTHFSGPFDP